MFLQNSGLNYRKIGKKINLKFSSVRNIMKKEKAIVVAINVQRTGGPGKLDSRQRREFKGIFKKPFF